MLLHHLTLQNIRSYQQQTIEFPEGSTLLSGDIGSGKSTILMAIEFALFGSSRPDLPAEALLRKGATQGQVELHLSLDNQTLIIQRAIKKEKDTIKQLSGALIINNIKKELMPVELKAEIIRLLGYPDDLLTKNKNYVFRYSVYCPQEEMKLILQEDPEVRLDTLRKIFNIDKYKNIRENLQIYLKQQRVELAILETKIWPLPQQEQKLAQMELEKKIFHEKIQQLTPGLMMIQQQLQEYRQQLQQLEEQQKKFLDIKNNIKNTILLLNEKETQLQQFTSRQDQIQLQLQQLSLPAITAGQLLQEIHELEQRKNTFISQRSSWQTKISQLDRQLKEKEQLLPELQEAVQSLPEKRQLLQQLAQELTEKEIIRGKNVQLDELFQKTMEILTKNQTILEQARSIQQRLLQLGQCPTCLQPIDPLHKEKICAEEKQKIDQAEHLLSDAQEKKQQILEQKQQVQQQSEQLVRKENLHARTALELQQAEKQQKILVEEERALRWLQDERGQAAEKLSALESSHNLEQLQLQMRLKQDLLNKYHQREFLEQSLLDLAAQKEIVQKKKTFLLQQKQQGEVQLAEKYDGTEKIAQHKTQVDLIVQQEKNLSIQLAQLQTQVDSLQQQTEQLEQAVTQLRDDKNRLLRAQELYHWAEDYFLPLTHTIEKQMMVAIHQHFQQLFKEWFSTLIDDENMAARLDDAFTPVIEQNGYEIGFANLSGGERTSAALAYRLALNKVVNDVIPYIKTKDLLILDEPTDGFSSEQLDKVRDVLDKLNLKQTIIVSHESKIETFVQQVIRITKEGQTSMVN
ncbi:SMC family ATPase [Candidatus Woesearchaeota archaeon]|nr:SMC family ATPase [Candidatus Woesearchaeota archaeon]